MMNLFRRNHRASSRTPSEAIARRRARVNPVGLRVHKPSQKGLLSRAVRLARVQLLQMRRWNKRKAILLGAAVLLCVSVPVALAIGRGRGTEQAAALHAGNTPATEVTQIPTTKPEATPSVSGGTAPAVGVTSPAGADTATPAPTATPEIDPSNTIIRVGITAPVVAKIQKRLMELDYMGEDEPTEYYGSVTSLAISLFHRQH